MEILNDATILNFTETPRKLRSSSNVASLNSPRSLMNVDCIAAKETLLSFHDLHKCFLSIAKMANRTAFRAFITLHFRWSLKTLKICFKGQFWWVSCVRTINHARSPISWISLLFYLFVRSRWKLGKMQYLRFAAYAMMENHLWVYSFHSRIELFGT